MNDEQIKIMCDNPNCNTEMDPDLRGEPFEPMPTTVSSTSPNESLTPDDYEDSEVGHLPEWVKYVCPKCGSTKTTKIS